MGFSAATDIIFIDRCITPFAKIFEKMPIVMMLILFLLYGTIAYFLLRSAYMTDHQH